MLVLATSGHGLRPASLQIREVCGGHKVVKRDLLPSLRYLSSWRLQELPTGDTNTGFCCAGEAPINAIWGSKCGTMFAGPHDGRPGAAGTPA